MSVSNAPSNNQTFSITTRKVIAGVLVILSVFLLFYLLYHFRTVAMLVFIGIVISISMAPVVDWLYTHKLPRSFSVILIYLGLLTFFTGIIFLVIPQMIHQLVLLLPRFESLYTVIKTALQNSAYPIIRQWMSNLPDSLNSFIVPNSPMSGETAMSSISSTFKMIVSIASGLFSLIVVVLLGFYWTLEGERVEYAFSLLLPVGKRESTRELIQEIKNRMGGFVRGQGLLALAIGGMALVTYSIIGLPSVLSLAFLAGMFELIPVIGPTLGAIPAVLVAYATNPSKIIWVILATILIQELENQLLAPRIMQKTVGVNPIVTILSIISFGSIFGFPGLLMAIPLAAVAQVILDRFLLHPEGPVLEAPAGRDSLSKLGYELEEFVRDIRMHIRRKESGNTGEESDEIEDALESIASDLEGLLAKTVEQDNVP
jgi:predicted PurR-regulated permease PerM